MCLITFQFHDHPRYKLILAANRDEFYGRPAAAAHFWEDEPNILAGRDLQQHGTWLGMSRAGRIAALTNFRDPKEENGSKRTRGEIIRHFLKSPLEPETFLTQLRTGDYAGFNLIAGDADRLYYLNHAEGKLSAIQPGTHGLSNHFLNTPWPKVVKAKSRLREISTEQDIIRPDDLFSLLTDAEEAPDPHLPKTGVGLEWERRLSPLFIRTPDYGTRASTVVLVGWDNSVLFVERSYEKGEFSGDVRFEFQLTGTEKTL